MMAELKDAIDALLPQAKDNPAALLQLANLMRKDGQHERALSLCREAMASGDGRVTADARRFMCENVPAWHFAIVRDEARNAAYDAALRRAVRPCTKVLEIGAGTGLLAMMAARAGAAQVVTCEMNPIIAQAAQEIVARNGFADRVRVIGKHSRALDVEADLGGPAEILVSEIVSNNLLGEDVLSAHEHAVRRLLKPGAQVIPARGCIRVALAFDSRDEGMRLSSVAGFDLAPFNALMQPVRSIRTGHERLTLMSNPADLFVFDFASGDYCAPSRTSCTCRAKGGKVNGVAQWIALDLDEDGRYENCPEPGATSCWAVLFHRLPCLMDTVAGQEVRVSGSHDRNAVTIWCDAEGGER